MGVRDNLRAFSERWNAEQKRMLTPAQLWGSGNEALFKGRTAAGEPVDLDTALTLPVVQRAFNLLAGDIGPLPIDTFRRAGDRRIPFPAPAWVETPDPANPNARRPQFISQCVVSLMSDGNLFVRAYPDRFAPVFLRVIDPQKVAIKQDADGIDTYRVGQTMLSAAEVVHVPWLVTPGQSRGRSPIDLLAESIASGLAAIKFGGYFFSNGTTMQGVIQHPGDPTPTETQLLRDSFGKRQQGLKNAHAFGILTGGATFQSMSTSPRDSQLLELQQFIVEDVGRAFGIPPYLLGSQEPGAVAYASTSNARIDYVQHAVQPIVTRIEHAFSTLIHGDDTFLRFNLNALLRGDQAARYTAYHTLIQDSVITKDEVRAWEDWGPADEAVGVGTEHGGFLETPNNTAPGQPAPTEGVTP